VSNSPAAIGSRPEVGSSSSSTSGSSASGPGQRSAFHHAARQFRRKLINVVARKPHPSQAWRSPPRVASPRKPPRYSRIGNSRFSSTVSEENKRALLKQRSQRRPISRRSSVEPRSRTRTENFDTALHASERDREWRATPRSCHPPKPNKPQSFSAPHVKATSRQSPSCRQTRQWVFGCGWAISLIPASHAGSRGGRRRRNAIEHDS